MTEIAEAFATSDVNKPPRKNNQPWTRAIVLNEPFTSQALERALASAKRESAPGLDGITFQCLRNLNEDQHTKLLAFHNDFWEHSALADLFVLAITCPILKHGKRPNHFYSYQPILFTPAVVKLLEMMALARL